MTKCYGVLVSLYDYTAGKIKRLLLKIRAFQINLLTKPYFVAEYKRSTSRKPTIQDMLNRTVRFRDLLEIVDEKTKKKINIMMERELIKRELGLEETQEK